MSRHTLSGLSTYGLKDQCVGDEHPAYVSEHAPPLYIDPLYIQCLHPTAAVKTVTYHIYCYFCQ